MVNKSIFSIKFIFAVNFIGFDKELLTRFQTILAVISNSQYLINVNTFKYYCLDTAKLNTSLYYSFYMPPTVHVVLIHGYLMVQKFDYPFGIISEEVHESKDKDIKKYRERYSRKINR